MLTTWMVLKPAGLLSSQGHQEYSNENTPYMTFHYFKKSLLSAYYEIVSVLGSWNTSVNTDKYPNSLGVSVQFSHSVVSDSLRPHKPQHARPPCPSPTPGVHPNPCPLSWWCHPTILSSLVPFSCPHFHSIRVFSNELALRIRWPKDWSFSFNISPSREHPGLISFRMDRLDLLAVQGTLKSLLQHHSSKASILRRSAFFTVQLSHPYTTTG